MRSQGQRCLGFTVVTFGVSLAVVLRPQHLLLTSGASVRAQSFSPSSIAAQVYERVPGLPREDRYISRETNKTDKDSTLVSRLIRYHDTVKGRSTNYRMDWKITLADYLGINDYFVEGRYPRKWVFEKQSHGQGYRSHQNFGAGPSDLT